MLLAKKYSVLELLNKIKKVDVMEMVKQEMIMKTKLEKLRLYCQRKKLKLCEAYNYINGARFDRNKQHDAKEDVRITYEVYKKIKDGLTEILNE